MTEEPVEAPFREADHALRAPATPPRSGVSSGGTMSLSGWIKTHRRKLYWPWFRHPQTAHLFEYLCLKATREPYTAMIGGVRVPLQPGQLAFGRLVCEEETGLSPREIRTGLSHLSSDSTIRIATHATGRCSVITIVGWETYQSSRTHTDQPNDQPNDQPTTSRRPADDQPTTQYKKEEKKKKDKKEGEEKKQQPPAEDGVGGPPARPRERNLLWDAVAECLCNGTVAKSQRGMVGKIVATLREKGVEPDAVMGLREEYRQRHEEAIGFTLPMFLNRIDGLIAANAQNFFQLRDPTEEELDLAFGKDRVRA